MANRYQTRLRAALDEPLLQLHRLLQGGKPYAAVRDFALAIADGHTAPEGEPLDFERYLLSPKWRESWETPLPWGPQRQVTRALFFPDGRNDDESQALFRVFYELIRYVLDATTPHRQREYAKQLQIVLDDYLSLRGVTTVSATEGEEKTPALSERKYLILQTLLELGAVSADARRTTAEIAEIAEGGAANPNKFKWPIRELKDAGLIDTIDGRGGGCWLTVAGKSVAERL